MMEFPLTKEQLIKLAAENLIRLAEQLGVNIAITRAPRMPYAMGNAEHVVTVWEARKPAGTIERPPEPVPQAAKPTQIDRRFDAGMREGCTVHIPGVGSL